MILYIWTGGSGKSFLMKSLGFYNHADLFKICSVCPISGHEFHQRQAHNSLTLLLQEAKQFKLFNLRTKKVSISSIEGLDTFVRDNSLFWHTSQIRAHFPIDDEFDVHSLELDKHNLIVYEGVNSKKKVTQTDSNWIYDDWYYNLETMPYLMIGEGGFETTCLCEIPPNSASFGSTNVYCTRQVEDVVPLVINGKTYLHNIPTPFFFLKFNGGFLDSLTQLIFEDDSSSSLAKGLGKSLVALLAKTNQKKVIASYAPIMTKEENDPLRQIDITAYTAGKMLTHQPFSKSTKIKDYNVFYTCRAPIGDITTPINLKKDGDIDRDMIFPLSYDGCVYGNSFVKNLETGKIDHLDLNSFEKTVNHLQSKKQQLYEVSLGAKTQNSSFKVVLL